MSVVIDQKLQMTKVLLVTQKPERALLLKQFLKPVTAQVDAASTIYEALQYAKARLPHVVICEAMVDDGSVMDLKAKLNTAEELQPCVVVSLSAPRTEKDKELMRQLGIESLGLSQLDTKLFLQGFLRILKSLGFRSPYAVTDKTFPDVPVGTDAVVLGRIEDQLILRSGMQMPIKNQLTCKPADDLKAPLSIATARDVPSQGRVFHVCPLRGVTGKGMSWLGALPELSTKHNHTQNGRTLYVVESDATQREGLKSILKGYAWQLNPLATMQEALLALKKHAQDMPVLYIASLTDATALKQLHEVWEKLPEAKRPRVLIAMNPVEGANTPGFQYLPHPYGLGTLLDALAWASMTGGFLEQAHAQGNVDGAGMPVSLQTHARLILLDEEGGVFESSSPFVPGTRIKFASTVVPGLWEDDWRIVVSNSRPLKDGQTWQVRFDVQQSGLTAAKYLQRLKSKMAV